MANKKRFMRASHLFIISSYRIVCYWVTRQIQPSLARHKSRHVHNIDYYNVIRAGDHVYIIVHYVRTTTGGKLLISNASAARTDRRDPR